MPYIYITLDEISTSARVVMMSRPEEETDEAVFLNGGHFGWRKPSKNVKKPMRFSKTHQISQLKMPWKTRECLLYGWQFHDVPLCHWRYSSILNMGFLLLFIPVSRGYHQQSKVILTSGGSHHHIPIFESQAPPPPVSPHGFAAPDGSGPIFKGGYQEAQDHRATDQE